MSQQNLQKRWCRQSFLEIGLSTIAVLGFICIRLLLIGNMGIENEADVLPVAKQYVDPSWIPGDWYLNQPPSYRVLFQSLFGRLIVSCGFLKTSILGRVICYSLVSWGLVLIARQMGLHLVLLLLAMRLFLSDSQGVVAGEWLVGGLEAKTVAYGLVILAIAFMLKRSYRLMALLLGLATSFHVLVGGYTFVTVIGWLLLRYKSRSPAIKEWGWMLFMYLLGSVFVFQAVTQQLFTSKPTGSLTASFIYVFLRLPHHLNPMSWRTGWWIIGLFYLSLLTISVAVIWFYRPSPDLFAQRNTCLEIFEFTLISLIPFIIGLAIAPFDSQGSFLQYYPFRLGDIMIPLSTCLLFTRAIQHIFRGKRKQKVLLIICSLLVSWMMVHSSMRIPNDLKSLSKFPSESQRETSDSKEMYAWVQKNTPKNATFISSPIDLLNFSWLAERPTIAKRKFLPQTASAILEWYTALCDLTGVEKLTQLDSGKLFKGYERLTNKQIKALMVKYNSAYMVTRVQHQLDLPVAYRNKSYIIYKQSQSN